MKIDSHQHFWEYHPVKDAWITDDMKTIQQDFMPVHLFPVLQESSINGSVAVQTNQDESENVFLLEQAAKYDFIKGVVGWIDLRADDLEDKLKQYKSIELMKGFRHIVQAEPYGFLDDKKFVEGVRLLGRFNFSYDILVYSRQLDEVIRFLKQVPDQRLVIDHCAKPGIKNHEIDKWAGKMRSIASQKNVYCKISGLFTEADWGGWQEEDFYPYLDVIVDTFGPDRIMFGSDWPVCLLAATYKQSHDVLEKYFHRFSAERNALFWGENAIRFYRL